MRARATILLFLSGLSGCITETFISKEQARQRAADGDDTDYCAQNDWYGDGVCDEFCTEPDPDCTFCGGIAGIPCPEGQVCVDDPSDD